MDEVKPITQQNLFDFWKRVQERKDNLTDVKRADEDKKQFFILYKTKYDSTSKTHSFSKEREETTHRGASPRYD